MLEYWGYLCAKHIPIQATTALNSWGFSVRTSSGASACLVPSLFGERNLHEQEERCRLPFQGVCALAGNGLPCIRFLWNFVLQSHVTHLVSFLPRELAQTCLHFPTGGREACIFPGSEGRGGIAKLGLPCLIQRNINSHKTNGDFYIRQLLQTIKSPSGL